MATEVLLFGKGRKVQMKIVDNGNFKKKPDKKAQKRLKNPTKPKLFFVQYFHSNK